MKILAIMSALLAIDLTEEDKLLATPLTNAGLPYAGYGYGCAGLSYAAAAPAKVEVKTVEASAVNFAAAPAKVEVKTDEASDVTFDAAQQL